MASVVPGNMARHESFMREAINMVIDDRGAEWIVMYAEMQAGRTRACE